MRSIPPFNYTPLLQNLRCGSFASISAMRASEDDWWFKFQNDKPNGTVARIPLGTRNNDEQSKRTMVKRFLHSLMYRVREKVDIPRNVTLNSLKKSASTSSTLKERPSDRDFTENVTHITRTQFTKLLRLCANLARVSIFDRNPTNTSKRRILLMTGLVALTSMASAVSCVCGGPLEKIIFHDGHSPSVEVHFLSPTNANKFYDHSKRNPFMSVNGYPLRVTWARPSRGMASGHTPLPGYIAEEVEAYKASRVIVLCRAVGKKNDATVARGYPDPSENYSADFNIDKMKWDFIQFGGIVEVAPMVLSKLSISIQYTDIRSAILAMHSLSQKGTLIHSKYELWHVKYVRDVTNKPCLFP